VPFEGITHPAGYDDPDANAYNIGGPSEFGEDVHPGPYRTSPAPSVPLGDEGYRHPAAQVGAPQRNASKKITTAAALMRAKKCIRIASSMLGTEIELAADEGDPIATEMIEDQAYDLMYLGDDMIEASLRRIEAATLDTKTLLRRMGADEDVEDAEDDDSEDTEAVEAASKKAAARRKAKRAEEDEVEVAEDAEVASKKAAARRRQAFNDRYSTRPLRSTRLAADEDEVEVAEDEEATKKAAARRLADKRARLAAIAKKNVTGSRRTASEDVLSEMQSTLAQMQEKIDALTTSSRHAAPHMSGEDETETMLAQMLAEEGMESDTMGGEMDDTESMLAQMLAEEGMEGDMMAQREWGSTGCSPINESARGKGDSYKPEYSQLYNECYNEGFRAASGEMDETSSMLAQMLAEEGMGGEADMSVNESDAAACYGGGDEVMMSEDSDVLSYDDNELNISMDALEDPMQIMGEDEETELLASIFASGPKMSVPNSPQVDESKLRARMASLVKSQRAPSQAPVMTGQSRTASVTLRPQPKKPTNGVSRVGNQTRINIDDDDLSKIWKTEPNISGAF
jgi:hypothetical protein